jgi:predicted AAA+ superfamily ATPase
MNANTHERSLLYVRNQLATANNRLYAYTVDLQGKPYPKRESVARFERYIQEYQTQGSEPRWITLVGLRGVGKTTLMAQLYGSLRAEPNHKLYIALDEATDLAGLKLEDILSTYEEVLGTVFENLRTPVYLFIDEVQYGTKWAAILKSIYDRSHKVFIFITGSAALTIQEDTDLSRRTIIEKLYPLSFPEYIFFKEQKEPPLSLSRQLRQVLLASTTGEEVYTQLKGMKKDLMSYWLGIDRLAIDEYIRYATLPFTLRYTSEISIYPQVQQTLNKIISSDIRNLKKFDTETLSKINKILYAIASADTVSLRKLSDRFTMAIDTLVAIFDTCAKAELLIRVYPYGAHYSQVKKPSKYLFTSSAYRNMFFHIVGSQVSYDKYKGALLEDIVGLYLSRLPVVASGATFTYDSLEGSADFILSVPSRIIPLEIGFGTKGYRQLTQTMRHVKSSYGLVISPANQLGLSENKQMISLPLEYFLLLV